MDHVHVLIVERNRGAPSEPGDRIFTFDSVRVFGTKEAAEAAAFQYQYPLYWTSLSVKEVEVANG